jgi:hypothetical protein
VFSNPVRFVLVLVCLGYGAYQLYAGHSEGLVFMAAGGLFAYGYFG